MTIHDAEEAAARLARLMAAATDSPGVKIRDGDLSVYVSRRTIKLPWPETEQRKAAELRSQPRTARRRD